MHFLKEINGIHKEIYEIIKEINGILKEIIRILKGIGGILKEIDGILKEINGILEEIDEILQEISGILKEIDGILKEIEEFLQEIERNAFAMRLLCFCYASPMLVQCSSNTFPMPFPSLLFVCVFYSVAMLFLCCTYALSMLFPCFCYACLMFFFIFHVFLVFRRSSETAPPELLRKTRKTGQTGKHKENETKNKICKGELRNSIHFLSGDGNALNSLVPPYISYVLLCFHYVLRCLHVRTRIFIKHATF